MWRPGTPITFTATDTAEALTSSVGLVKAIRFMQHWDNTHKVFWGDSNLAPATPAGISGWLPPPGTGNPVSDVYETDAPNGINADLIYVAGAAGEVLLWAFLEQ